MTDRYTVRDCGGISVICPGASMRDALERIAAYEDTGLTPERVAELAEAERDGRVVVLPCPVGGKLYRGLSMDTLGEYELLPLQVTIERHHPGMGSTYTLSLDRLWEYIGGFTFLSREDAEAAFASRKGGDA